MIHDIAEILKGFIEAENLPYVDSLSGLVQTETVMKKGKKGTDVVEKSFPIYCPTKDNCDPNKITPLVPDKDLRSLFYFERNGDVLFRGREKGRSKFTADLLLTGWLNPKLLGYNDCSITAPIIAELLRVLDRGVFNDPNGVYSMMIIKPISLKTKERSIFQRYKLGDKFYHLLEYPYDYFQIRVQVEFALHDNCMPDFVPQDPKVC